MRTYRGMINDAIYEEKDLEIFVKSILDDIEYEVGEAIDNINVLEIKHAKEILEKVKERLY